MPTKDKEIAEKFIGPKSSMITPWSTNAVEITRNMGLNNINRIEAFINCDETMTKAMDYAINQAIDQNPELTDEYNNRNIHGIYYAGLFFLTASPVSNEIRQPKNNETVIPIADERNGLAKNSNAPSIASIISSVSSGFCLIASFIA